MRQAATGKHPGLLDAIISYSMQLGLFFKIGYVCEISKGAEWSGQLAVKILCNDFIGCDEVNDYFATEADTTIEFVYD